LELEEFFFCFVYLRERIKYSFVESFFTQSIIINTFFYLFIEIKNSFFNSLIFVVQVLERDIFVSPTIKFGFGICFCFIFPTFEVKTSVTQ